MTPDCAFALDNGQPCRCPALRGDEFCRHHTPEARARRRHAPHQPATPSGETPGPDAAPTRAELSAYWRRHHQFIPRCDAEALENVVEMILNALASRDISHRSAGRLMALIAGRRDQLQRAAEKAAMDALHEQLRAFAQTLAVPGPLDNYPVSAPPTQNAPPEGPGNYLVSRQVQP